MFCFFLVAIRLSARQQDYTKITESTSMKFCGGMGYDPGRNSLHFGVDLDKLYL